MKVNTLVRKRRSNTCPHPALYIRQGTTETVYSVLGNRPVNLQEVGEASAGTEQELPLVNASKRATAVCPSMGVMFTTALVDSISCIVTSRGAKQTKANLFY